MCMETLEKHDIYEIHQQAIDNFGGTDGIFEYTNGKIESILAQQYPHFGYDKYPTVFEKSAMLVYFFTKNHCFPDGNKRVALYSLDVFLTINNYELMLNNEEAENLILEIAESQYRGEKIDLYIYKISNTISKNCRYIET